MAAAEGTPLYVYSASLVEARYRALDEGFGTYPHSIHYALKANSTLGLLRLLRGLGAAADANSIWEIEVARRAGFEPRDIVFTGVGKSPGELARAVPLGLRAIIVESAGEWDRVDVLAREAGVVARVALRINPDIDAGSHPHISTGLVINKFGVPTDAALDLLRRSGTRVGSQLVAVHLHVGSQITSLNPIRQVAAFAARIAGELAAAGVMLEYLDVGGGLGIAYDSTPVVSPEAYTSLLVEGIRSTGLPIVIEPGRSIVGPAGCLIAQVVDLKARGPRAEFAVIDAGMTELMRPALYDAFHRIEPVRQRPGPACAYEVVGPVCESSDVMGRDRTLPKLAVGDLVAIRDAGAYGAAMASNYNRRPLPVEVLVADGAWQVLRRRQSVDDLLSLES